MINTIAQDKLRYRVLHAAARLVRGGRRRRLKIQAPWPWAEAITAGKDNPGARGTPGHPARQPGHRHTPTLKSRP